MNVCRSFGTCEQNPRYWADNGGWEFGVCSQAGNASAGLECK